MSRAMSIGAKATTSASTKAASTAIGNNMPTKSRQTSIPRASAVTRSNIHRGSRAGLNDQKVVRLNHNNAGYLNPSHQLARRGINRPTLPESAAPKGIQFQKVRSTFNDTRLTKHECSSISRLSKIMN